MARIQWDKSGEHIYETGVNHGVLYLPTNGVYSKGVAWNGLSSVDEKPSGAEASAQYADNIKYLNLISAEQFAATIQAFTYPDEFAECDGSREIAKGVSVGQQEHKVFGLSYSSLIGNDLEGTSYGYKIHLIYGALAAPSEKSHSTVNESPEAISFSWELSTTPVEVPGMKNSATLTIDSTKTDPAKLKALEDILYGTETVDPRLPLPAEIVAIVGAAVQGGGVTPGRQATPVNSE